MINFGGKKDETGKNEGISVAMRAMSDQIGRQAQEIKRLQEALEAAQQDASAATQARAALAAAEARMAQMEVELQRLQAQLAATSDTGPADGGSKSSATAAQSSGVTDAISSALGGSGVVKIGAATPAAPASSTGGLQVGGLAYVQKAGGKNLRLRSAPGLDSTVLDSLPPGTQLTLLAGPQDKDGYPWWRIRTSDGREGWVAGTELVVTPED
ncbi:MAG: SH3 domain-containing protein [Chloroflexus sp.]